MQWDIQTVNKSRDATHEHFTTGLFQIYVNSRQHTKKQKAGESREGLTLTLQGVLQPHGRLCGGKTQQQEKHGAAEDAENVNGGDLRRDISIFHVHVSAIGWYLMYVYKVFLFPRKMLQHLAAESASRTKQLNY